MNFRQIVERLQSVHAPGILGELDPFLASLPDPSKPPEAKHEGEKKEGEKRGPFGDPHLHVDPGQILPLCRLLRDDPHLQFDLLISISGCDYSKQCGSFGLIYHILSTVHKHRFTVRADVPKSTPEIDTVESIWSAANWPERETYDFYGIVFRGHSDLRRILLGDDWVGWPMRKDYVFPTEYHGISCV